MLIDAFVNIKNSAGAITGGPLPVTNWRVTRRVDRAGSFEFTTPFDAAQIAAIVVKATAEIYAYINGAYTLVGTGTIDSIEQSVSTDDSMLIGVAGDDQLRELNNRTTGSLLLAQDDVLGDWSILATIGTVYRLLSLGSNILLAATGSYIYRSIDNGVNWIIVFTSTGGFAATGAIDLSDCGSGVVLAAGGSGIQRSTDYGQTWTNITTSSSDAVLYLGSGIAIYARYNSGAGGQYIYRSTDSGATWDAGRTAAIGANTVYCLLNLGGNNVIGGCSGRYICRSTDNGVSWGSTTTPNGYGNINYSLVSPVANTVLAGSDTGYINISTDNGANWSVGAYLGSSIAVRALSMFGSLVIAGAGGKVFASADNGATFTEYGDLGSETATYSLLSLAANVLAGSANIWLGSTIKVSITHAAAVAALEALAPAGWDFVADGSPGNDNIFIQFAGESVLAGALLVAERSRGHCYLSGDQELTFADTWSSSGIHAIAPLHGQALGMEVCGIGVLTISQRSYDVVTRIYPRCAGGAYGIAASTIAPGTGYTKDTTYEYVQHTDAQATYSTIEAWIAFDDIAEPTTATEIAEVADALVRAGVTWLEQYRAPLNNYRLTLLGCSALLEPMQTVRISYMRDGWNLDATLNILESTWSGDERGILTTELVVADSVYWIDDDQATVARAVARVNGLAAR